MMFFPLFTRVEPSSKPIGRSSSCSPASRGALSRALLSAVFSLSVGSMLSSLGCHGGAASEGSRTAVADRVHARHAEKVSDFDRSAGAQSMGLSSEMGVYDSSDIEDVMHEHFADIRNCYGRAGHARRYAGGKVMLRFEVDATGKPTDVLMVQNSLGNRNVESCLFEVSMNLRFPPPIGDKATSFDYPIEFKSTHELPVLDLDSHKIDRDVSGYLAGLASCGKVSNAITQAVFYIEPSGRVGSAGLQSQAHVDRAAADCVVQQILKWRMSASLPGRALRCHAALPATLVASSEGGAFRRARQH